MASETKLPQNRIKKLLTQTIKQAISNSGIRSSTRSGNKELGIVVKKVTAAPFAAEADVQKVGTLIGEKIVELSKQSDKQSLDVAVVRRLALKPGWMAEFDIPEQKPTEKTSKKASKSAQTVITPPTKTEAPATKTVPVPEPTEPEPEPPVAEEVAVEAEEVAVEAEEEAVESEEEVVDTEEESVAEEVAVEAKEEVVETDKTVEEPVAESAAISEPEKEAVPAETPEVKESSAAEEE